MKRTEMKNIGVAVLVAIVAVLGKVIARNS